ncbi:hypothetical protein TNCV_451441 [Trichonephila clavipes]|nr:hypothetical protein TNCV_451441 [Trichonephila clavipes]
MPSLREITLEVVRGLPPFFPFLQPHEMTWFDGNLEYSHVAKALYIYKRPCLLRDSNTAPTARQFSFPNHCTGWVARILFLKYESNRYSSLDIFYGLPMSNLSVKSLGTIFGRLYN